MPNRLANEKSPYLRQHADNPVDWHPWGPEAFARAKAENKPVFLSIGYSTCHWCHVMAHESFENAAVAEVLNRDYVSIKVDREERPDVDRIYMTYVQQTAGHGGWPMSVWLTADAKPFHGGTYFPPDDRHGRPGFVSILNAITQHWQTERGRIEAGAEEVLQALRRYAAHGPAREVKDDVTTPRPLHESAGDAFSKGFEYFYEAHDPKWGGFGGAPKFPRGASLQFLSRVAAVQGVESEVGKEALRMVTHTLQRMAEGGIHDHVGGGFHRYSVDERWHVPHFEKMLYDQAQIALNCLDARQGSGIEAFAWVARGIFAYVQRDLTSPQGAFYSAEDADSADPHAPEKHAEGAFYVWEKSEIDALLGPDAAFFCAHFGVNAAGNVQHDPQNEFPGKNVLMQQQPLARTAEKFSLQLEVAVAKLLRCLNVLREARQKRPRPHLDDKVITAWNGLMISALARGAQVLGEQEHAAAAARAAAFVERELYDADRGMLYRSWREGRSDIPGFAEDYAYLIQALLDLYEATFELRWVQWAERLQREMNAGFWDTERGGFFNSRDGDATVIVRLKEDYDGAEPAPNSVAALNLVRLDWMLGVPEFREMAQRTIEATRVTWSEHPHGLPAMLVAVEALLEAPRTVVIVGNATSDAFRKMSGVLHERLGPRRAVIALDGEAATNWWSGRRAYLNEMRMLGGEVTAYVCEEFTCQPPVTSAEALRETLAS